MSIREEPARLTFTAITATTVQLVALLSRSLQPTGWTPSWAQAAAAVVLGEGSGGPGDFLACFLPCDPI